MMNNKFLTLILALSFVSAALAGYTSNEDDTDDDATIIDDAVLFSNTVGRKEYIYEV